MPADDLGEYDVDPVEGNPFGSMASSPNDYDVESVDHDPFSAPDEFRLASRQPESPSGIGSDARYPVAPPLGWNAPPLDPGDRDLLIKTVYGETSGEPESGQAGVAHAILNRVRAGNYGEGIKGVVTAPAAGVNPKLGYHEFSPWNTGRATEGQPAINTLQRDRPADYERIGNLVDKVYGGQIPDPTGGATHYYGRMRGHPSWSPPLAAQNQVRIGGTTFVGREHGPGEAIETAGGYAGGGPVQLNADLRRRLSLITRPRFADGGDPEPVDPPAQPNAGFGALDKMTSDFRASQPPDQPQPAAPAPQVYGGALGQSAEDAYQKGMGYVGAGMNWLGDKAEHYTGAGLAAVGVPGATGLARDLRAMVESGEGALPPVARAESQVGANVLRHADEAFPEGRIATAVPDTVALRDSAHASNERTISHATMQADPEYYGKTADLIRNEYPDLKLPANATDEEVHQAFIAHAKDNILALHDAVPDNIRSGSQQWYDGANSIASNRAQQYSKPLENVAGVYAALSPKMDWFKNVSLGDRLMDIMHNQKWSGFTPEMNDWVTNRYSGGKTSSDLKAAANYSALQAKMANGMTLADLSDPIEQAHFVRAYDEAHNPRGYNIVNPDGSFAGPALKKGGQEAGVGWAGFNAMANAITSFNARDMPTISEAMGDRHKVRSFYNNIVAPNSLAGDVTADTHAIAAAHLRPFSLADREVEVGLGGKPPKSGETGAKGLYGLYAEAYRQAAAARNILPRQMQSITWEALRGLWSPAEKSSADIRAGVDNAWGRYGQRGRNGLTLPGVQQQLLQKGITPPAWHTGAAGEELEP